MWCRCHMTLRTDHIAELTSIPTLGWYSRIKHQSHQHRIRITEVIFVPVEQIMHPDNYELNRLNFNLLNMNARPLFAFIQVGAEADSRSLVAVHTTQAHRKAPMSTSITLWFPQPAHLLFPYWSICTVFCTWFWQRVGNKIIVTSQQSSRPGLPGFSI